MDMHHRSYGGKIFRPTPEVHIESDGSMVLVVTCWGNKSPQKKLIQTIVNHFQSSEIDLESTSEVERLLCLTPLANLLRSTILVANEQIYKEENADKYTCGFELFLGAHLESEFSFVQIGQPQVYSMNPGLPLVPISASSDLNIHAINKKILSPPLPRKLLGIEADIDFSTETIHLKPEDKIVLLSRSFCPSSFLSISPQDANLESMTEALVAQDEEMPFWIGVFS